MPVFAKLASTPAASSPAASISAMPIAARTKKALTVPTTWHQQLKHIIGGLNCVIAQSLEVSRALADAVTRLQLLRRCRVEQIPECPRDGAVGELAAAGDGGEAAEGGAGDQPASPV